MALTAYEAVKQSRRDQLSRAHPTRRERLVGRLALSLPLDTARLPAARRELSAFLTEVGIDGEEGEDLVLCAQEALKNAIRFSGSPRGVDVEVRVTHTTVSLMVRDYGCGLDGAADRMSDLVSCPPDPLAPAGRGFYVMATLMDELELCSQGGLEVRMVKRIG